MNTFTSISRRSKFREGVTLVEVLIVVAIAVPMIMAFVGVLGSVFRSERTTREQESLQNATLSIFQDLSQEAHVSSSADLVEGEPGDVLTLFTAEGDVQAEYSLFQEQLLKNMSTLTDGDIEVKSFQVEDIGKAGGVALLKVRVAFESKKRPDIQLEKEMTISLRKRSFSSEE